jgi:hypothetical protein
MQTLCYVMLAVVSVFCWMPVFGNILLHCRIWGFHFGDDEECRLMGFGVVWVLDAVSEKTCRFRLLGRKIRKRRKTLAVGYSLNHSSKTLTIWQQVGGSWGGVSVMIKARQAIQRKWRRIKIQATGHLFARGFFFPEDGGDSFLRNVGSYKAPHLRIRYSSLSFPKFKENKNSRISAKKQMIICINT